MNKLVFVLLGVLFLVACSNSNIANSINVNDNEQKVSMINPWIDCNDDLVKASKIAGFTFPLILSNYWVRAMDGMIEINYPLDEVRNVCVRKVATLKDNQKDISGVYTQYPINKEIKLENDVPIQIRADENKIYVINMSASSGYYSAYCEKGMSLEEVEGIYKVIAEAETPKLQ